jgi:uncharacterized DUF497 family protein
MGYFGRDESSAEWYNSHICNALQLRPSKEPATQGGRLYTVIFEIRKDDEGEIFHLVTLWKATAQEVRSYEESS